MSLCQYVATNYLKARELAEESLNLAQRAGDQPLEALGHWYMGVALFALGEFNAARNHLGQVIAMYEPRQHHHLFVLLRGSDFGLSALAYDACCLWCLGYPDQALKRSQVALEQAQEFDHPFTLADVLDYGGCMLSEMRQDYNTLLIQAEELIKLANERLPAWQGTGLVYHGVGLIVLGRHQDGLAEMQESKAQLQATGVLLYQATMWKYIAEAYRKTGQLTESLAILDEALSLAEETNEHYSEAELHRLRGELLLMQGNEAAAEAGLKRAIEIACQQSARSWELRATLSLARLWQRQDKQEQARKSLVAIYDWFTEGLDTPDLIAARALIEELG
jgi:predicted ATPase